jgi:hypothetical protein
MSWFVAQSMSMRFAGASAALCASFARCPPTPISRSPPVRPPKILSLCCKRISSLSCRLIPTCAPIACSPVRARSSPILSRCLLLSIRSFRSMTARLALLDAMFRCSFASRSTGCVSSTSAMCRCRCVAPPPSLRRRRRSVPLRRLPTAPPPTTSRVSSRTSSPRCSPSAAAPTSILPCSRRRVVLRLVAPTAESSRRRRVAAMCRSARRAAAPTSTASARAVEIERPGAQRAIVRHQ